MNKKSVIFTDLHIGVRNSSNVFRNMFKQYFNEEFFPYIEKEKIETIFMLGDFFDSRTSVSLNDIDYVMNEWIPEFEKTGAIMYVIAGNHDVAYRNTNTISSLSMLKHCKNIHIISDEVKVVHPSDGDPGFVLCPWLNDENNERLLEEVKHYNNEDHILCLHAEFAGMKMYQNSIACQNGLDVKTFSKFKNVLSGHFHHPSKYGNVEYIGAIGHYNWQDYNDWRGFLTFQDGQFERHENKNCIFEQLTYTQELLDKTDEELSDLVKGKIIRVVINNTYDKVELKDLIYKIEIQEPVSVDVIDNTILDNHVDINEDGNEETDIKSIEEYVDIAIKDNLKKVELKNLFDEIYQDSVEKMKEIE